MKVLVTGANGMLAKAVIEHCGETGDEITAFTRQELDISDREDVFERLIRIRPEAVINCAAYTDVDGSETNDKRCYSVNAAGVENLALACRKIDAAFVTVSTDYVFDGSKTGFYTQIDTPNPQSEYGRAKFAGEILAQKAYARSIIVRSGWIFDAEGANFLSVMKKLFEQGQTIKAIADSHGTPTSAVDLAKRLRELALLDLPCIYHVTNSGEGASYADFARTVCEIGNFDEKLIETVSFADLKRPAPRPVNSKLACLFSEKFGLDPLPDWKQALRENLKVKKWKSFLT